MFVRVVRFTDVTGEKIAEIKSRIGGGDGPPEGVPSTGIKVLADQDQGSAVVLQYFDTAEDMAKGAEVLSAMDASETPGTRASVDACELIVEMDNS